MVRSAALRHLSLALALILSPACTLVAIDSEDDPPGVQARGLVDGHVAFGLRQENHVLHFDLFDGTSSGAIGELVIWKLFRAEVGLAGASLGLGPVDLALGTLFYDPRLPAMGARSHRDREHGHRHEHDGGEGDEVDEGEHGDGDC